MSECDLPPEVATFVADHVESVVQLEVLLLLYRNPSTTWTADAIAAHLRIGRAWVESQLEALDTAELLTRDDSAPGFRYAPRSERNRKLISGLAKAYDDHRVTIISLIYGRKGDKLRSFADAFRFRQEGANGC